ncbi:MAG TPA: hypothetical protein DC038_03835 [Clostridiales bacterium]|nr:hypothetical protein [Clostridiales bacterium]
MIVIILDGSKMTSRDTAHKYIKECMNFPEYYGENLDALWDLLSTWASETTVYLLNEEKMHENLGEYGELLKGVFQEAAYENDNICFVVSADEEKIVKGI